MESDKSKQESLERQEYDQDKGELSKDTLKQKLKHHEDAIKNLKKEIESLEKDKSEDQKDVKQESSAELTKQQKKLPPALQKAILKRAKKSGENKSDDKKDDKKEDKEEAKASDLVKVSRKNTFGQSSTIEVDIQQAAQKYFGGKTRSELKSSDFLFPDKRSFPIVTPADVPDAVSNFGRMSGSMSYDEFKKKLVSFAKKKGAKFVAALPSTIKKEFDLADATQIAVFPDKYVDPKDVGTVYQDTRPINKEGYEIDDKIKEQMEKDKLKNPQLRSAQQRAEGLR